MAFKAKKASFWRLETPLKAFRKPLKSSPGGVHREAPGAATGVLQAHWLCLQQGGSLPGPGGERKRPRPGQPHVLNARGQVERMKALFEAMKSPL